MKKNKTKLEKKVDNYNELEKKNIALKQDLVKSEEYYNKTIEDYKKEWEIVVGQNNDIVNHCASIIVEISNANSDLLSNEERIRRNIMSLRQNGFIANLERRGNDVFYRVVGYHGIKITK